MMPEGLDVVLVCLAQDINEANARVADDLANVRSTALRIGQLESKIEGLRNKLGVAPPKSDRETQLSPVAARSKTITDKLDWDAIRARAEMRLRERGVDPASVSLDTLLDERELERIERRFMGGFRICSHLDCYDLAVAGIAGLVAALVDFLIVKIPTDVVYLGERPQEGSPLTKWMRSFEVPSDNWLSRWFKVSFDKVSSIDGLGPRDHRLHSLGHDPFIGLVIGTIDIMRGGLIGISKKGELLLQNDLGATSYNPLIALVYEIGHLVSDGFTKMGLPPPGWSLTQLFQFGSFGEKERSVAELARWMYLKGYDSRHFLTMATSVTAAEVVLRGYFWIRRKLDHNYELETAHQAAVVGSEKTSDHPRFRAMALLAHGVGAAANAGKIIAYQGNPLAINYAQWLRFFHALVSWMRDKFRSPTDVLIGHARANLEELERGWPRIDAYERTFPRLAP